MFCCTISLCENQIPILSTRNTAPQFDAEQFALEIAKWLYDQATSTISPLVG